jgi:hypothetical protein
MGLQSSAMRLAVIGLAAVCLTSCESEKAVPPEGREKLPAFEEFSERVSAYMSERERAEGTVPELKDTSDPKKLAELEKALADAIRTVRAGAQQGAVFTEATSAEFRRLIAADFQNRAPEDRTAVLIEVPFNVPPRINTDYPTNLPLATVPPSLLLRLPTLPDALEYRFLGRNFILRDTKANLIVDFVPDAVPVSAK